MFLSCPCTLTTQRHDQSIYGRFVTPQNTTEISLFHTTFHQVILLAGSSLFSKKNIYTKQSYFFPKNSVYRWASQYNLIAKFDCGLLRNSAINYAKALQRFRKKNSFLLLQCKTDKIYLPSCLT